MKTITKRFIEIPENALHDINIVLSTRLLTTYNVVDIEKTFDYNWTKISESIYDLTVYYEVKAYMYSFDEWYEIPIYVTIEVFFLNQDKHFITQSEGE